MLAIQNLTVRAGTKLLFENASINIHPGQKLGVIGHNGAGKTTLFKTITGELGVDAGQVLVPSNWLLGVVQQEERNGTLVAHDYVSHGDSQYASIMAEIERAQQQGDNELLVHAYDQLDKIDGYLVPTKTSQLLYGLGFTEADFQRPISDFSGGWQVRLRLARALMQRADLLLLDEPTNHLDIEAVAWLEQWLKAFEGAVLIISHDRDFLDSVVQGIVHIHQQKMTYYAGNFAAFERQRNEALMQQQALHEKQKQKMQHLKTFIARFKAKASKAKQAQSRIKALERMEMVAAVQALNPFSFAFAMPAHQPDPMLYVNDVRFGYDAQKPIIDNVALTLRAGDRIGLVGVNGSGKSTLIKLLVGELVPTSGKVAVSKGVKFGYFAQHQLEALTLEHSPLQHLLNLPEPPTDQEARDFLGGFGFSNQQCLDPIAHFSGGEKARLALAIIVYQKPNLIILDEPTNHLDMETRDALDMALQEFDGALILVTHDKHLLTSIVDQYWWVHELQVTHYMGDLESYLQERLRWLKERAKEQVATDKPKAQSKKELRQASAQQRKQIEVRLKPIKQKITKLEKQLEKLQMQQAELLAQMEDSSLYEAGNKTKLTECIMAQKACDADIEACEESWLQLQDEYEQGLKEVENELGLNRTCN